MQTYEEVRASVPRENYTDVNEYAEVFNNAYAKAHIEAEDEVLGKVLLRIKRIKNKIDLMNAEQEIRMAYATAELQAALDKLRWKYSGYIFHDFEWSFRFNDTMYIRITPLMINDRTDVVIDMNTLEVDLRRSPWMKERIEDNA
jgi:hypothetical protein